MEIARSIDARGGIVRRDAFPEWRNARLRQEAAVRRIGTRWLVTSSAPPLLVEAARRHARLACVSAAEHLGLALRHPPRSLHLHVPGHAAVTADRDVRLHRSRPLQPVGRGELVESVPDVLVHVAHCLPRLEALVVWESALHRGLLSRAALRRLAWPGPAPRALAAVASPHSESILETLALHGLREAGLPVRQQVRLLGHRVDFLVAERLVVQVDGFAHHAGAQREEDLRHDARLLLEGLPVLRFGYAQVVSEWTLVLAAVRAALAGAVPFDGRLPL